MKPIRHDRRTRGPASSLPRGFSLIEISLVLIIAGLALGAGLQALGPQLEQRRYTQTQQELERIADAIVSFMVVNGRLPCPAVKTPYVGNAPLINSNGREAFCQELPGSPNCTFTVNPADPGAMRGRCFAGNAPGTPVWRGLVPSRDLGIANQNDLGVAVDAWSNPITYSVSNVTNAVFPATWCANAPAAVEADCNAVGACHPWTYGGAQARGYFVYCDASAFGNYGDPLGSVCLNSPAANACPNRVAGDVVFSLISRGRNGGYGAADQPVVANANEGDNRDNNRFFVRQPLNYSTDVAADFFDDIVVWRTKFQLVDTLNRAGMVSP